MKEVERRDLSGCCTKAEGLEGAENERLPTPTLEMC